MYFELSNNASLQLNEGRRAHAIDRAVSLQGERSSVQELLRDASAIEAFLRDGTRGVGDASQESAG